ncbi:MAG: hypothetical protein CBB72_006845 [Muricauda sp. TMED12]|nr:MAG: hypothetical protein CBB72_006845 [Muricauda sp. TMED12]
MTVEQVKKQIDHLFEKQYPVLSLWQTLADHFYPERADFTTTRNVGDELADGLMNTQPVLMRRDLCNSFSAMLRDGDWFKIQTAGGSTDHSGNMWLDFARKRLMTMMGGNNKTFVRATKQGDHDYGTFGQCVISTELNKQRNGLLYRNWHLRDCAWFEDEDGSVGGVARKWKPSIHQLIAVFGEDKVHRRIVERSKREPFAECEIRHFVIPARMYGDESINTPYVSLFIDADNNHLIEEVGINHRYYTVPRFQTIAGAPYAYSPATITALPDARTLQAMTFTLMEAAERYARPPIIATERAVRSDIDLSSDGITWVDDEYDEKLGAALRTLQQDRGGFPIGKDAQLSIIATLQSAFYLNKITLPPIGNEMTATEVIERMKQYRRENLPLFAPIESEYNGSLCEISFEIAMAGGLLGSPYDIPESLQSSEIEFKFNSPLSESQEEEKATQFAQVSRMLAEAAQFDQNVVDNIDFDVALRDASRGVGVPNMWMRAVDDIMARREQRQVEALAQTALQVEAGQL